jgi:2-polyprenyl-3-methyl-5-hydroxy-6-metoxy-1,4-benzoquinol methylase
MSEYSQCPQCGGTSRFRFEVGDLNRRLTAQLFRYDECDQCRLVFQRDTPADLALYYASDYYLDLSVDAVRRAARAEHDKIDIVLRYAKAGRLLEIGASRGVFAWLAREAGFAVEVIEMDRRCCTFINDQLGISAVSSEDPAALLQTRPAYDVIALWHVAEHLPDPWPLLDRAAANLAPGGILVVATPNPDSLQFRLLGAAWPHVDAPRHTCLIPAATLAARMCAHGLTLVDTVTDDRSARSASRFGWGAWLSRPFNNKLLRRSVYLLGCALSVLLMPLERGARASAYTAVFRK